MSKNGPSVNIGKVEMDPESRSVFGSVPKCIQLFIVPRPTGPIFMKNRSTKLFDDKNDAMSMLEKLRNLFCIQTRYGSV